LSALATLARDEAPSVGFLVGDGRGAEDDGFNEARALLGSRYRLREVLDADEGAPVPPELDVLVIARPTELHPRAVFAIDQYLQGGGRVLCLLDPVRVDLSGGRTARVPSGLAPLLAAWGVEVSDGVVWDQGRCNALTTYKTVEVGGQPQRVRDRSLAYPMWPAVDETGLEKTVPVTGRQPGVDLFWAVGLGTLAPGPDASRDVRRQDLAWTSDDSWIVPDEAAVEAEPDQLNARGIGLVAGTEPAPRGPHALLVALTGRVTSPFEDGAPGPYDPIQAALHEERVRLAVEAGEEPPAAPVVTSDDSVASRTEEGMLVLAGDADWCADGRSFGDRNKMLFESLVDWLAQADELVELRARLPRERRIRDFLAEEREARGLDAVVSVTGVVAEPELLLLESEAAAAAARKRLLTSLSAMGAALLLALVLGVLFSRLTRARAVA
jgi:hypothetical protein